MFNLFNSKKSHPDWSFQEDAISNIVRDFQKNKQGRFLLVLPTGGGKTIAAIRSLNEMINRGIIGKEDRVLWVVHTLSLRTHARENIDNEKHYSKFSLNSLLRSTVDVRMKADAVKELRANKNYKFIIIDEAHHSAADTYRELFEYPVGILGLTATPHRMDKRELPFEKISYSITFRELVRRGVVLLPKFLPEVRTNLRIEVTSFQDEDQLERFNSKERNQLVSDYIFREVKKHNLKKIIVFAGTNAHVERLFEIIKKSNARLENPLEHVGYIYGGNNNEKSISNDDYLKWHHSQPSSILVNCKILNEGYDDPNIDTVVMATPTNSILYYLQCIGRVVRTPEDNKNARAYVIEIVDRLPNVLYRIDNRWLFAEISDYLEPHIVDIKTIRPLRGLLILTKLILLRVRLKDLSWQEIIALLLGRRINMLLFNDVPTGNTGRWRILAMPEGDLERIRMFNDVSENIEEYYPLNHEYLLEKKYPALVEQFPIDSRAYRSSFMAALHRAYLHKNDKELVDSLIYLSVQ